MFASFGISYKVGGTEMSEYQIVCGGGSDKFCGLDLSLQEVKDVQEMNDALVVRLHGHER